MPTKCAAFGCITNYDTKTKSFSDVYGEKVSTFYIPLQKPSLLQLVTTLRAQSMLIEELLANNECIYVLGRRLQSEPSEQRFSQYRQMSGGRFLVNLREVLLSERILKCRSLLKENVNIWEENMKQNFNNESDIVDTVSKQQSTILGLSLNPESHEVAFTMAGYIAKKLTKRFKRQQCCMYMIADGNSDVPESHYFNLL